MLSAPGSLVNVRAGSGGVAALAVVLTAGACGSDFSNDLVQRTDSAGVTIVTNLAPDLPLAWTREPVLRLGGEDDGPEAFYRVDVDDVAADAARRLYVLDTGAFQVHVFDEGSRHLRTMGREGEGPGELKHPVALFIMGDGETRVVDLGKRTFIRFAADGSPLPEIPLPAIPYSNSTRPTPVAGGRLVLSTETVLNATGELARNAPADGGRGLSRGRFRIRDPARPTRGTGLESPRVVPPGRLGDVPVQDRDAADLHERTRMARRR